KRALLPQSPRDTSHSVRAFFAFPLAASGLPSNSSSSETPSAAVSLSDVLPTGTHRACFHWQTSEGLTPSSCARLRSERPAFPSAVPRFAAKRQRFSK